MPEELTDIDADGCADLDLVAVRPDRVARAAPQRPRVAGLPGGYDPEPAHHAPPVQEAVVATRALEAIALLRVKIAGGEVVTGLEVRPWERARRTGRVRRGHGVLNSPARRAPWCCCPAGDPACRSARSRCSGRSAVPRLRRTC